MEKNSELYKQLEQAENFMMRAGEMIHTIMVQLKDPINFPKNQQTPIETTIKWSQTEGKNGKYEKADVSENNTKEFTELQKQIDEKGKLVLNGMFYWIFDNGSIGRKPSKTF